MAAEILTQSTHIDQSGRVLLPLPMLEAIGVAPETDVLVQVVGSDILIRSKRSLPPITAYLAEMALPVADWTQMEREIEEGRSACDSVRRGTGYRTF